MKEIATPYVFISYSHEDFEIVEKVVAELNKRSINVWFDRVLQPGQNWADIIQDRLRNASALIIFLSSGSPESERLRSLRNFVVHEGSYPIMFVLLDEIDLVGDFESLINHASKGGIIQLTRDESFSEATFAHRMDFLVQTVSPWLTTTVDELLTEEDIQQVSRDAVREARGKGEGDATVDEEPPDSVFIVHGHDNDLLEEVGEFVRGLGIKTVILGQISSPHQTLVQKFFAYSREARFAIVLISGDDLGASVHDFYDPTGGKDTLRFRTRQNVVLELGFFYGFLDFESVFPLYKKPARVTPYFERPSDLAGVLFEEVDSSGHWRDNLKQRLKTAGFVID